MKMRYVWMILAGLLVAIITFASLQGVLSFRASSEDTQTITSSVVRDISDSVDNISNPDLSTSVVLASFESVVERRGLLSLQGRGQEGAILVIRNNANVISETQVDTAGRWQLQLPTRDNEIMDLDLSLRFEDRQSLPSDEMMFRVPLPLNLGGTLTTVTTPPALLLQTQAGKPSQIIQSPFGRVPTDGPLSIGPIDYDDLGAVIFTGASSLPGRVRIYASGNAIGDTQVQPDGTWTYIRSDTLSVGAHDITVELNVDGEVVARISIPFKRLSPEMAQSANELFVHFEANQWQLRRGLPGGGAQYTVIMAPDADTTLPVPGQN